MSKNIKYLEINLIKELRDSYNVNFKALKKEVDEPRRWKTYHSWGLEESLLPNDHPI